MSALATDFDFDRIADAALQKRSIIFVNRFFYPDHSATSQIMSDLAFDLARKGVSVQVVTSRGLYGDRSVDLPPQETIKGIRVHRVFKPRFEHSTTRRRALDYLAMYRAMAVAVGKIARANDVVVAKTDPPLLSVALAPVVRAKGAVLVNWLQDLYPEVALGLGMSALRPLAPFLKAARNASLRSAAYNIAIGEIMAERLLSFGVSADKIKCISNWCGDEAINPTHHENNLLRKEWGLEGKFVVGYSGNLGRVHEFETLLGAAEQLKSDPNIKFLFIGGGHLIAPLKAAVASRGLDAQFLFKPYQDEELLTQSLTLPDVHWLSLAEQMEGLIVPSKFYGIAAAGRPTIAVSARDGEIARIIRSNDCGLQVDIGDSERLAAAICDLRGDRERLEEMGRNAKALVAERFNRSTALDAWHSVARELVAAP